MLAEAGLDLSHVVRLNLFTTDVDRFLAAFHIAEACDRSRREGRPVAVAEVAQFLHALGAQA